MMRARLAFVNARMRARKAQLLDGGDLLRLAEADRPAVLVDGWSDLTREGDASAVLAVVYRRLVAEYAMAIRACPDAAPAIAALLRMHEVENVKLAWRAVVRRAATGEDGSEWTTAWRPMAPLETVSREACRAASTVTALVDVLKPSPYRAIADSVARAHADDLAAAERAIDRWAAASLDAARDALPAREAAARALLALASRRRDGADARRSQRRRACRRALLGSPYSLAPLIAYLLLRDAEASGLVAVAEARVRRLEKPDVRAVLDRVM